MPHYTSTPANNGDKTVILEGWIPRIVVIGPGHEELAQECLELLNEKRERERHYLGVSHDKE